MNSHLQLVCKLLYALLNFGSARIEETDAFAVNFINDTWQYFDNNYLLQFQGEKSISLFQYKTDKRLINKLVADKPNIVNALERKLKAYIQQYNNRLIENKMTVK